MIDKVLTELHQPEYTGKNRCEACTIVNIIIAAVLSTIISRKSKPAGAITVGISLALIYLRGYLVPRTPALTKRYFPPSVLRLFGKDPEPTNYSGLGAMGTQHRIKNVSNQTLESTPNDFKSTSPDIADSNKRRIKQPAKEGLDPIVPEEFFLKHNIVESCVDVDDLCLTKSFETKWHNKIDQIDPDAIEAEDLVILIGLTEDETSFEIEHHGDSRILRRDGQNVGQWPSQAALVADITAAHVLDSWANEWESLPVDQKGVLLNNLRLFLETCPTTDGEVVMSEETIESCCQSNSIIAVTCKETGERLYEQRVSGYGR